MTGTPNTSEGSCRRSQFTELHVPALDFYDVKGDIHYDDGAMTFSDVKARVYGGIVTARGDYNVDSRVYHIYLHGEGLDSRIPTKEPRFYCLVTLDGEIHCDGNVKDLVRPGSFHALQERIFGVVLRRRGFSLLNLRADHSHLIANGNGRKCLFLLVRFCRITFSGKCFPSVMQDGFSLGRERCSTAVQFNDCFCVSVRISDSHEKAGGNLHQGCTVLRAESIAL